jgi:CDP-paratose 2-epimerase
MLRRQLQSSGVAALRRPAALSAPRVVRDVAPVVIFGGAGFIGANLADAMMHDGDDVVVFDNLSRPGVERNLNWLAGRHAAQLHFVAGDIRDQTAVAAVVKDARAVFHLAAQVAVTSSMVDPLDDFSVNAQGTLNILESIRQLGNAVPLIFASTNKVYGGLAGLAMEEAPDRYMPASAQLRQNGVDETRPLDFCTPYGCSKGTADQYVLDYAHTYGLQTAVLRKSCIYGPRQFGTEDQGWVAHFLIRALLGEKITIYGDGKQVRDVLHVSDAVAAYRSVLANIGQVAGQAFNLGGGVQNAVSLRTVLEEIAVVTGRTVEVVHAERRTGDQLYFVADTGRLAASVGWRANIGWQDGLRDLAEWLAADLGLPAVRSRGTKRGARA